jgi:hypothetical protein
MDAMYAFCGLDCAQCSAYQATQANDRVAQEKVLAEWRAAFGVPDMPFEAVICDGCQGGGRLGGYCSTCTVRACSTQRGGVECVTCPDYGCATLESFLQQAPQLRTALEARRHPQID